MFENSQFRVSFSTDGKKEERDEMGSFEVMAVLGLASIWWAGDDLVAEQSRAEKV